MSGDCNACFYVGDYEPPDFCYVRTPRARKPHRCGECRETIPVGDCYERASGMWDGMLSAQITCLVCAEIRDAFACEGFLYGFVWESIEESMFEAMTIGCLNKLKTARAKQVLQVRWNKWKGLQA